MVLDIWTLLQFWTLFFTISSFFCSFLAIHCVPSPVHSSAHLTLPFFDLSTPEKPLALFAPAALRTAMPPYIYPVIYLV